MHRHSAALRKIDMAKFAPHDKPTHQSLLTDTYPPLEAINRPHVPTDQAAFYLCRRPQTLRGWAMTGKVIQPLRINGRLCWPVSAIREVLGVKP